MTGVQTCALPISEAYLYEYNERSYITVGEEQFSGIRIDTIPRIQSM